MKEPLSENQIGMIEAIQCHLAQQAVESFSSGLNPRCVNWDSLPINKFVRTFNKRVTCLRNEGHFDVIETPIGFGTEIVSTSN